jgi:hypothetical protein
MKKRSIALMLCVSLAMASMPIINAGGGGNSNAIDEAKRRAAEEQKRADDARIADIEAKQKAEIIAKAQAAAWAISAQAAALAQSAAYEANQRGKEKPKEIISNDFPAIQHLQAGVVVAIKSNMLHKYLKVEGSALKTTGTTSADPACQFEILRYGDFIGFRSIALQKANGDKSIIFLRPDSLVTGSDSPNFAGDDAMWEQFAVQTNDQYTLNKLFFLGKASKAYLTTYYDISSFSAELQAAAPTYLKEWTQTVRGEREPGIPATEKNLAQEFSIELIANLPSGFRYEEGKLEHIACGSDLKGKLIVYGLDHEGDVLSYDVHDVSGKQAWNEIELKLPDGKELDKVESIALACDGTGLVLANKGLPYLLDVTKNTVTQIAIEANGVNFEDCATGNRHNMWALDADNMALYQCVNNTFIKRETGNATAIAVALDGGVVKLDKDHKAWILDVSNSTPTSLLWSPLGNDVLQEIAIASRGEIVGIRNNGTFVKFKSGNWIDINDNAGQKSTGLDEVAINAASTTVLLTTSGAVAISGTQGITLTPTALKALTIHAEKKSLSVGNNEQDEESTDKKPASLEALGLTVAPAKASTKPTRATAGIPVTPGVKTKYVTKERRPAKAKRKPHVSRKKQRRLNKKHTQNKAKTKKTTVKKAAARKASGAKKSAVHKTAGAKKPAGAKKAPGSAAGRKKPLRKAAVNKVDNAA